MLKKILYTLVFSIHCLLLFLLGYWLMEWIAPGWLFTKNELDQKQLIRLTVFFLIVVWISFQSASSLIYGDPTGN